MFEPRLGSNSSTYTRDILHDFPKIDCNTFYLSNRMIQEINRGEWGSDLGLFLSGLFNFYQFATFEVKDQFLSIIDLYITNFDKELLLSLPGFMICMLPALEDQNAEKLKKVEDILKKTE